MTVLSGCISPFEILRTTIELVWPAKSHSEEPVFRLTRQSFETFPGLNNTKYCFLLIPTHKNPPELDQVFAIEWTHMPSEAVARQVVALRALLDLVDQNIVPDKQLRQLLSFARHKAQFAVELDSWASQAKPAIKLIQQKGECSQAQTQENACETAKPNPAEQQPAQQKPVKKEAAKQTPVEKKPAEKKPAKKTSAEQQPAEKKPAEQQPAQKKSAKKKAAKKKAVKQTPVEKQPAQKKPAQKKPAEKQPAEKQPAEQQPLEQQPLEKQPTEKQPAERQLASGTNTGHSRLSTAQLHQLHVRLGYFFKDIELLQKACCDPSSGDWNNNRLALLGDEVLDVIALHDAIQTSSTADGSKTDKSVLRNVQQQRITRKECALTAIALGLDGFVQCGGLPDGRPTHNMSAEAYEAVIAAIFEDGGFDAALAFWKRMQPKVNSLRQLALSTDPSKHVPS